MAIAAPTGSANVTSYVSSSATSCVLDKPTNLVNGDVLVAAVWARSNTAGYTTIPTGWTESIPTGGDITGPGIMRFYRKVITNAGAEPANYTWSGGVAGRVTGILFRVTGANTASPLDATGAEATAVGDASSASVSLPTLSASVTGDLLIAMTGAQIATGGVRGTFNPPLGWTRVGSVGTSTGSSESDFAVDVLVLTATGPTGAKTFTKASAVAAGMGYMYALKAAVGVTFSAVMSPAGSPSSADVGVPRTITVSWVNGPGTPCTIGPVDWGDGLAADAAVTSSVSPVTFTRTPTVAGSKTAAIPCNQA
jgi:hypothetical protein